MEAGKLLFIMILVFIILTSLSYFVLKPKLIVFASVSEEKCQETNDDDCWHSLAHQTFNRSYCLKILDNETKKHCSEHIPKINKEEDK